MCFSILSFSLAGVNCSNSVPKLSAGCLSVKYGLMEEILTFSMLLLNI